MEGPRDGRELPANWVSALCKHEVGNAEKTLLGKTREGLTGNGRSARVAEIEPRERQRAVSPARSVLNPLACWELLLAIDRSFAGLEIP